MRIVVVGCGRVGSQLAYHVFQQGHQVTVIDQVAEAFANLPSDFRGHMVEGEALSQDVLRRAGIEQADALAAVTNSDALNAVVAHVARSTYHVGNVVVRNYDPRRRPLLEAFGLQVISTASWGARRIEELLYNMTVRVVFSAGNGEVEICEFAVPEAWHGQSLDEVLPEGQWQPVALTRAGRGMLVTCDTRLEAGDLVHLSATFEGIQALQSRLNSLQEA